MNDLESLPNPEEIEAFLKGKPVSAEFIAQLEEHTKALIEKLEASTKEFEPLQVLTSLPQRPQQTI
jgi:hypothetical protein